MSVELYVDGHIYSGWTEVRAQLGMDRLAGQFELYVSERWRDAGAETYRPIRPGAECLLNLAGDTAVRGYVDDVLITGDGTGSHTVTVRGRDRSADLVDCSADVAGGALQGLTLGKIAAAVASPFGVPVADRARDTTRIPKVQIQPGETAFELLDRLARQVGVLLMSDGEGGLVIDRADEGSPVAHLELGQNVTSVDAIFTHRERYDRYRVLAQRPGDDFDFGDAVAQVAAEVADERIRRYRPLILVGETSLDTATATRRAEHQRNIAFGRSRVLRYALAGFSHDGGLWRPNRRVTVRDAWLGVDDVLLIEAVEFRRDERGSITYLTLVPPETWDRVPLPEPSEEGLDKWVY